MPHFDVSPARHGLDWLLEQHPHLELLEAKWIGGPWLTVTLGQRSDTDDDVFARWSFAIWKRTGAVHGVQALGDVTDDPLYVP